MKSEVQRILDDKGAQVFSISAEASVLDAVHEMNAKGVGALLVLEDDKPAGIFSERDVLRRVVENSLDPATTKVAQVMTRELIAIKPSITAEEAMAVITSKRCRHLPVVEAGKIQGMISIGDLTRWSIRNGETRVQQLVDFVSGKYPA